MRQDWDKRKIGEICEVLNGFAFKSSEYVENGIRVIRITNVQKGFVVDDDPKYYPMTAKESIKSYLLNSGDLLMSLTGNVGRVGVLQKEMLPAALNQRVACLRIKDKRVLLKYLFHNLNSPIFEQDCINSASGVAQKNMSTEWLKKYLIGIPPIAEQEKIVAELDCLTGIIEKKKQQLEELDKLAQSIFYDMFGDPITNEKGWEMKKLKDVAEIVGGSTPKTNVEEYWNGQNPWVAPAELHQNHYISSTERGISNEAAKGLTLLPVGTVLLSSRAPIGKVSITTIPMYCNQGFKNVVCSNALNNEYVYHLLLNKTEYLNSLGTGATFKEISKKTTENIAIAVPPIELQEAFAAQSRAIEKQKELVKRSIVETETLFNSRMDYWFN